MAIVRIGLASIGLLAGAHVAAAQCGSGAGGSIGFEHMEVVYSISSDGDRMILGGAAVVRAPAAWRRLPPSGKPAMWRNGRPMGGGASVGPVFVLWEGDSSRFWIDDVALPARGDNLVLLDLGPDGKLHLTAGARVDPVLPGAWRCPFGRDMSDAERNNEHARQSAAIEAVVRRWPVADSLLSKRRP